MASTYGSASDFAAGIRELRNALPADSVSTDKTVLDKHSNSTFDYHSGAFYFCWLGKLRVAFLGGTHSVVVYPSSTEDAVTIVKTATKFRMPVVPYSGATGLEGHFRAVCVFVCAIR